jgi:VWFA-related protein
MTRVNGQLESRRNAGMLSTVLAILLALVTPAMRAQSASGQTQTPPAGSQPAQDIPDAPSAVQPPMPKPPAIPAATPDNPAPNSAPETDTNKKAKPDPFPFPDQQQDPNLHKDTGDDSQQAAPAMPPVQTVPAGNIPRNQLDPKDDIYKLVVRVNVVQIPVMVKDSQGRRVDGLLPKDFSVYENGKKQTLSYFTSDPFPLSVAVLLDIGMPDVALQKVNQTYSSLAGAFSPYDEVALYTYSSTVSQVTDFSAKPERLTAMLNEMKLVRGRNNGPPVLGGPLASGPQVNGAPAGGPIIQPVNTPPREAHVLNDAILEAAQALSRRDRTRRKVIFVISDGRELGSKASYADVLRVLETRDIQVKGVVVDAGAIPVYRELEKIHLKGQGYSNILPKYTSATGGGQVISELSRNAIENAYAQITSEARNQYTLAYTPKATTGPSAYRGIEVRVQRSDVSVYSKDGYYPAPGAH